MAVLEKYLVSHLVVVLCFKALKIRVLGCSLLYAIIKKTVLAHFSDLILPNYMIV